MNFLDNLLRYPRFFISSMIGLILVLVGPILNLIKEIKNKNIIFCILLIVIGALILTLNSMLNSDY